MSKLINLTGQHFGRLTVLYKDTERKSKTGSYWICQCKCGKIVSVRSASLRNGSISSCGCYRKEKLSQLKTENLLGQKFGLLTVIEKAPKKHNRTAWLCRCDCGNQIIVTAHDLKSYHTQSCGCQHQSLGELEISKILDENKISYIPQYRFLDFLNRIYDFAIIENGKIIRLIEFDGEQHYQENSIWKNSLKEIQKRDKEKNKYAISNNIPLVRIPYWERGKLTLELLFSNKYIVKGE